MPSISRRRAVGLLSLPLAAAAGLASQPSRAQLTDKLLRLVVPYPPGGSIDGIARILAEKLGPQFPGGVVIENRPGANGNIGADSVFRSAPDGTSLLLSPNGPVAINQNLYKKLSYDPTKWVPVAMLAAVPNVLAIHPSIPATDLNAFIAYLKANPDKVAYASQGSGSSSHLAAALFMLLTGTEMAHVPYKGTAPALNDLIGGQVGVFFDNLSSSAKFESSGKLRILAVADTKRSPRLPAVPTFAEAGPPAMKQMLSSAWYAAVAPPGTPASIVNAYQKAFTGALSQPDVKKKFADLGVEPDIISLSQTDAFIHEETVRWSKVIRDAKVTAD